MFLQPVPAKELSASSHLICFPCDILFVPQFFSSLRDIAQASFFNTDFLFILSFYLVI